LLAQYVLLCYCTTFHVFDDQPCFGFAFDFRFTYGSTLLDTVLVLRRVTLVPAQSSVEISRQSQDACKIVVVRHG
jgi:hypothetical protein